MVTSSARPGRYLNNRKRNPELWYITLPGVQIWGQCSHLPYKAEKYAWEIIAHK